MEENKARKGIQQYVKWGIVTPASKDCEDRDSQDDTQRAQSRYSTVFKLIASFLHKTDSLLLVILL